MAQRGEMRLLTPDQERIVRAALAAGETQGEAAYQAGVDRRLLQTRLRDQLADVRVGRGRGRKRREDPTPEEIAQRMAEIRRRNGHSPA